jgi:hypothetical protein
MSDDLGLVRRDVNAGARVVCETHAPDR